MTAPAPFLALIVDDSRSARFALGKFLENLGFTVESLADAKTAIAFLDGHRPDVVFLDHDSDDLQFETLYTIKAHAAGVQIVLCASDAQAGLDAAAKAHGAAALMIKPPIRDELSALLAALLPDYATPENLAPIKGAAHTDVLSAPPQEQQSLARAWHDELPAHLQAPAAFAFDEPEAEPLPPEEEREEPATRDDDIREGIASIDSYAEADAEEPPADVVEHLPEPAATAEPAEFAGESAEPILQPAFASAPPDTRLLQLEARVRLLEQNMQSQLMELRMQLDLSLRAQVERIEQNREAIRATVSQEAQIVAERTVMNAAEQLSDRLAEQILKTLERS